MSNRKKKSKQNRQTRQYSMKSTFAVYVIYWLIIFMLVVLVLFSVGHLIPGWAKMLTYVSSLVLAGIATWLHVTPGHRSKFDTQVIDDLAKELK